jgi:hypothetical protein
MGAAPVPAEDALPLRVTRMNKTSVVLALALTSLAGSFAHGQSVKTQPVLGQGNVMCRAWTDVRRADPAAAEARTAWVLGFLTAYSQFGDDAKVDVSEGKSTDMLVTWVDEYCARHPHETLQQAATSMVSDLRAKAK